MSAIYPQSVVEVLDTQRKYKPAALRAVKDFARSKPWAGSLMERQEKFRVLNEALAAAYGFEAPKLVFGINETMDGGSGCYLPALRTIILKGRLSVVTYLHEFAHFLYGGSERTACRWSLNLFRRCFPRSWARLRFEGHMVRGLTPAKGKAPRILLHGVRRHPNCHRTNGNSTD